MNLKFHDITMTLSNELLTWPSDPRVRIKKYREISKGDKVDLTMLSLGAHAGTHMDAPSHFLKKGAGADSIRPEDLIQSCYVKEVKGPAVSLRDVQSIPLKKYKAVLFRTRNSAQRLLFRKKFFPDYVALGPEAAGELVKQRVRIVGIDYLSIEKFRGNGDVHRLLLRNRVIILETLDLTRVKQGEYLLISLPLKIKKGDGAPLRAILIKKSRLF